MLSHLKFGECGIKFNKPQNPEGFFEENKIEIKKMNFDIGK